MVCGGRLMACGGCVVCGSRLITCGGCMVCGGRLMACGLHRDIWVFFEGN